MKASIVTLSEIEIPSQMFAVLVTDEVGNLPVGSMVALFSYADAAKRWGDMNYANRFKIVEVRL